ncbi:hypothetical protein BDV95DRAFT_591170 [Massariosphaeria phaeospora]|uniref:Uncharacterized protein n=1 Tax=Massariosphaeria phaeospora TaxID=100035 RepID=A0A7C8IE81_9PLEO|nr:hypothetical protein BDV95DRAFT_591170 [Massariosphaeria phaeospora]
MTYPSNTMPQFPEVRGVMPRGYKYTRAKLEEGAYSTGTALNDIIRWEKYPTSSITRNDQKVELILACQVCGKPSAEVLARIKNMPKKANKKKRTRVPRSLHLTAPPVQQAELPVFDMSLLDLEFPPEEGYAVPLDPQQQYLGEPVQRVPELPEGFGDWAFEGFEWDPDLLQQPQQQQQQLVRPLAAEGSLATPPPSPLPADFDPPQHLEAEELFKYIDFDAVWARPLAGLKNDAPLTPPEPAGMGYPS